MEGTRSHGHRVNEQRRGAHADNLIRDSSIFHQARKYELPGFAGLGEVKEASEGSAGSRVKEGNAGVKS